MQVLFRAAQLVVLESKKVAPSHSSTTAPSSTSLAAITLPSLGLRSASLPFFQVVNWFFWASTSFTVLGNAGLATRFITTLPTAMRPSSGWLPLSA